MPLQHVLGRGAVDGKQAQAQAGLGHMVRPLKRRRASALETRTAGHRPAGTEVT